MPYSRYSNRRIFLNNDKNYKNVFFKERDIKETYQYDSPRFAYPAPEVFQKFTNVTRTWKSTDKLYNLANEYYGSPTYWWVIAWYNQKASASEFYLGEIFLIPLPLEDVLGYLK
jgi:hypothetical protein